MAIILQTHRQFRQKIMLSDGQMVRVGEGPGWRVRVVTGLILLTSSNELRDHELATGQALMLDSRRLTLMEAIGDSVLILEPLAAPPARWKLFQAWSVRMARLQPHNR